jgi:hypothetical protein
MKPETEMSTLLLTRTISPQWRGAGRQVGPAKHVAPAPAPSQSHTVLQRVHTPVQLEFQFRRVETARAQASKPARPVAVSQTD